MQDPLEAYVANLLKEKGEPDTPESRSSLLKTVNEEIDRALLGALPLGQFGELETAVKNGSIDDNLVEKLLMEAGVDSGKIIKDTLDDFRDRHLKGGEQ